MSAKWRAIQHRHRYTYSAVIFPDHYIESLNQIEVLAPKLYRELKELVSLTSTYSQVNHVKNVASSFSEALSSLANGGEEEEEEDEEDGGVASLVVRAYLEIMFFENSLPLHRTLVSALGRSKKKGQNLICGCFKDLCGKYGNGREKRFCVPRAVLSVMGLQKLGFLMGVVEDCAVLVAKDVVDGLCGVVDENLRVKWARPSPIVMEQCQESLSCLYYLLQ